MDTLTGMVYLAGIAVFAYLARLLIVERGDFEAGGRAGTSEFFLKAKARKK
jgi:hypothetical protein